MEKYTVIIPTRDRAETLEATLRTCLRQTYKNFEIIVSDNCSTDNTREIVDCLDDPRIRYVNPGRRLSMSGNFEFALGHVTDGFVMFIGSDDGIMPDAIEYVDSIVRQYEVDAVSCRQASYVWPDFPDRNIAGQLTFGGWRNDVEVRNSKEWINKTLNFQVHYCFDLPNLYCGFVHKRIIDKSYKDGKYFHSITPDAYSAFATAIFINKYAYSHKSFSIAGASSKSNGASALNPSGNGEEANKFYSENDIEFCEGFVNCPSYEVLVAEAFAKLAQAFPEHCSPYKINYSAMIKCALKNANSKTEEDVRNAVGIMGKNFAVEMEGEVCLAGRLRGKGPGDLFRAFISMLAPSRVVAILRSGELGINNIDDAALAAHLFNQRRNGNGFITNKELITQILKRMFRH